MDQISISVTFEFALEMIKERMEAHWKGVPKHSICKHEVGEGRVTGHVRATGFGTLILFVLLSDFPTSYLSSSVKYDHY